MAHGLSCMLSLAVAVSAYQQCDFTTVLRRASVPLLCTVRAKVCLSCAFFLDLSLQMYLFISKDIRGQAERSIGRQFLQQ